MSDKKQLMKKLTMAAVAVSCLGLVGCCPCQDIMYDWDIPASQADCPADTVFRDSGTDEDGDLGGGSGIVDRSGGSGIVDRDGNPVLQHCYRPCANGETPVGKTIVDWQNTDKFVVGYQICATGEGGNGGDTGE